MTPLHTAKQGNSTKSHLTEIDSPGIARSFKCAFHLRIRKENGTKCRQLLIYADGLVKAVLEMKAATVDKILKIVKENGVIRPRDIESHGIPRKYLTRMYQKGLLSRVGRGLYVPSDVDPTEHHTIAEVCKRVQGGIVCLISALQFHGLTTQMPSDYSCSPKNHIFKLKPRNGLNMLLFHNP